MIDRLFIGWVTLWVVAGCLVINHQRSSLEEFKATHHCKLFKSEPAWGGRLGSFSCDGDVTYVFPAG